MNKVHVKPEEARARVLAALRAHDYKGIRLGESATGDFSMPRLGAAGVARTNETKVNPAPLVNPTVATPVVKPATPPATGK